MHARLSLNANVGKVPWILSVHIKISVIYGDFYWQAIVDDFGTLDWGVIYRQLQRLPVIARKLEAETTAFLQTA